MALSFKGVKGVRASCRLSRCLGCCEPFVFFPLYVFLLMRQAAGFRLRWLYGKSRSEGEKVILLCMNGLSVPSFSPGVELDSHYD